MNKEENLNYKTFGLIGRNISYSFSPDYFANKFKTLGLKNHTYQIFDLKNIAEIESLLKKPHLFGLNVTIPYKEEVIPYLDALSDAAKSIGAVNTIAFKAGKAIGYNTDYIGFQQSIQPLLKKHHSKALILGSGGANKAVQYALKALNIPFMVVSRDPKKGDITYQDINDDIILDYTLIINTTPLGTHPNILEVPKIPLQNISEKHLVYDLIYNPEQTRLLQIAKEKGATTKNGLEMLELQADAAWEIWS